MGGHRCTYFCQSEVKLRKLDRFLVSQHLINLFPSVSVVALSRELFDHYLVIPQSYVPENFRGYGSPDGYLAAKLRFLKNEIRKWRAKESPKESDVLMREKSRVHELDTEAETRILSEYELEDRRTSFKKIASKKWHPLI